MWEKVICNPAQESLTHSCKLLTRMTLSVLLMFLLALAPSSGSRCQEPWNKQEGYNEFSEKHILSKA
ncbi:hypothetical protein SRHO_G00286230 [Serrasalmus rhombeus]